MISVSDTLFYCNRNQFNDIVKEAHYQLLKLNNNQIVKDDIFRILKNINNVHVIQFPVEDNNFCAFIVSKDEHHFIFINTALPLEKQIFAAAHELYHLLYEPRKNEGEILNDLEAPFNGNENEMKANCFAACFLVPENMLFSEIKFRQIEKKDNLELIDIIKLMDTFAVPYKTMVLRLHETGVITDVNKINELLMVLDRNPKTDVLYLINKTGHALRWQKTQRDDDYSSLKDLVLTNYENNAITFEKAKKDFELMGLNIKDFMDEEN